MLAREIQRLSHAAYKFANFAGNLLLLLMFSVVFFGVFCRYALHYSLAWPEETSMIFIVWMSLFGASMGLKDRAHVGTVAFLSLLPEYARKVMGLLIDALVGFFGGYLMVFGWKISVFVGAGQRTVYWGIPYFYLYLCLSIGGLLLLIQAVALISEDIRRLLNPGKPDASSTDLMGQGPVVEE
jgi:TRAP-type transport system small permease protein